MERLEPPFRAIVPGKVFRQETTDASHEHTFHQMEGLVIDKNVSVGHPIGAMKTLLRGIFKKDIEVRLRPGYFPFVEPGFELDARCPFCTDGCSVCKKTTWIELLPCGLVHPNVLKAGGLDPEEWGGFAFGLGLSRVSSCCATASTTSATSSAATCVSSPSSDPTSHKRTSIHVRLDEVAGPPRGPRRDHAGGAGRQPHPLHL